MCNPVKKLKDDIRELQKKEGKWASLVQVPHSRALELVALNATKWKDYSNGFLEDDEIDHILSETFTQGPAGLNGLSFGLTRIQVATRVEDDCDDLRILEGRAVN
jgi:hypothetical protein